MWVLNTEISSDPFLEHRIFSCFLNFWKKYAPVPYTIKFKQRIKNFVNQRFLSLDYTAVKNLKFSR